MSNGGREILLVSQIRRSDQGDKGMWPVPNRSLRSGCHFITAEGAAIECMKDVKYLADIDERCKAAYRAYGRLIPEWKGPSSQTKLRMLKTIVEPWPLIARQEKRPTGIGFD